MPQATVYVRNEDWDKWKSLDNKAEAISRLLNEKGVIPSPRPEKREVLPEKKENPVKKNNSVSQAKDMCSEHLLPKSQCKLMKHTGKRGYN